MDTFTPQVRSACMSRIKSSGNRTTELRFIQILRINKIHGWRRGSKIMGKPDFVFHEEKIAIFIDGDFWHGNPKKYRQPKSNCEYWRKKISSNRSRDRLVNRRLRAEGWAVARFWESDLSKVKAISLKLRLLLSQ